MGDCRCALESVEGSSVNKGPRRGSSRFSLEQRGGQGMSQEAGDVGFVMEINWKSVVLEARGAKEARVSLGMGTGAQCC